MSGEHPSRGGWRGLAAAVAVAGGALLVAPLAVGASTTWTLATSPNPGTSSNTLAAVTCPSPTVCWAVGQQTATGDPSQTLIEEWNGTSWSTVTSGNINAEGGALQGNQLDAVSCDSTTDCWAVGRYRVGSDDLPLGEHWNGSAWTASALPEFTGDPAPVGDYVLEGISCSDATDCWAVGYFGLNGAGNLATLMEQWASGTWSILTSGGPGFYNGISCVNASDCYAVGGTQGVSPAEMLVASWDGHSWQGVGTTNQGSGDNVLDGISCTGASYCWAVGYYSATEGGTNQDLFLNYDGTTWTSSAVSTANENSPSEKNNLLSGLSCTSASACWAVGSDEIGDASATLVDAWDGTAWSLVADTPNGGGTENSELLGVACGDSDHCAAVGDYGFEDPTLILMYTAAESAPVPASGAGAPGTGGGSELGTVILGTGVAALLAFAGTGLIERRRAGER